MEKTIGKKGRMEAAVPVPTKRGGRGSFGPVAVTESQLELIYGPQTWLKAQCQPSDGFSCSEVTAQQPHASSTGPTLLVEVGWEQQR